MGYTLKDNVTAEVSELIARHDSFVVTDSNVYNFYAAPLGLTDGNIRNRVYIFKAGEKSKNLRTLSKICGAMIKAGCGRSTRVVAIGGGVTGDLAGFAAAVYMRGVKVVQVPTTLLAMADSSIGGKTGVDFKGYKNIIGAFLAPENVLMGINFLSTLEAREIRSGIGEIVKTALLDSNIFDFVSGNIFKIIAMEPEAIKQTVRLCADFKDSVTGKDFKESGLRKCLNLGHTVGHALESCDKFRLTHGEYVLSGIFYEAKIGLELGITDKDYFLQITDLVHKAAGDVLLIQKPDEIVRLAAGDKKNRGGKISLILPVTKGEYKEIYLSMEEFGEQIHKAAG